MPSSGDGDAAIACQWALMIRRGSTPPEGAVPTVAAGVIGSVDARRSEGLRGVVLAVLGVAILSPDALIIRSIHAPPATILFWRGLLSAIALSVLVSILAKGRPAAAFRAIGRPGLLVAMFQAGGNVSFVVAVTQTATANVLVIVATAPLFAALLSWLILGERVPLRTWLAIGCVVGAVAVVLGGSLATDHLQGDLVALVGSLCSAAAVTVVRHARGVSMIPAMVLAALIGAAAALTIGVGIPEPTDRGLFLVQGLILLPAAIALITTSARRLPAPEVSLISRLELVLGSLWVWLVLAEAPSVFAIVGGVLIIATLSVHTWLGMRAEPIVA
jgi:drug/metabolite transporter (DMT)-like permease